MDGIEGIKDYILDLKKDNFTKSLVKNLFAYALGRDVNFADEKEINNIVEEVKDNDYSFRTIIEEIVMSPSFYKKEESWFNKLASNFSGIGENFLLEIPQIIQDVESCSINSEELLSYFEIEIPSSNDDLEIPEELQDRVLGDDRFICLSEKLELSDVLEFLYTGTLSDSVINSANECDISKEEIEDLDISELLNKLIV